MNKLLSFVGVLGLLWSAAAMAGGRLDPAASYSCVVLESNDKNIPVGTETNGPLTVASLERGAIALKPGANSSLIDFYGPLESYDLLVRNSGIQAFSSPPTEPREIHGSIVVNLNEKRMELSIKVFPTTRAFSANGTQAFILADVPQVYKLTCSSL